MRSATGLMVTGEGMGAEIRGIDPASPGSVDMAELRRLVYTHKLVVLKDVHPTPEQFLALGRSLGTVVPYYEKMYRHPDHPEIFVSSTDPMAGGVPKTGAFWHIDYQFMPQPFALTMTLPLAVPGPDRGTSFIDLSAAWATVPDDLRRKVRGTRTVSSPRRYVKIRPEDVYRPIGEVLREIEETTPPQVWPTVVRHPVTGEEFLYVCEAFAERIIDADGQSLDPDVLQELLQISGQCPSDAVSPLIHTQFFGVGDILLWDNRILVHSARHGSTPGTVTTHRLTMCDGLTVPGEPA
ncbi:TauD/TfdA family dioxygenase [Corynebacterium sp.]|uniref:(3R)-3-[(carboxymethyl)amino]fatty acid oxygenase/decarboxylase n=1 Tax=Corynebacterium sp. TaxID=1720 RepID=UPI002649B6ED|nr:TauD/TfdA family dioxygenase [Corynebacterium sp.]MDN5721499.1 TauD/TfdA family dioxygenase [Corynebacterium sp.]MDN6281631.1 TauD/TfdA family dioxygenase [Corynebacterium sp.]MDN6351881.1 TauD/TfdA family dioxygenase [Corynebacterium sp.]MDN6367340.1 TauD/TfdA family dioxygenase [Corynebacterium sp.]MDN6374868.1 TauD/TfdA family dioxygenase [Corynebacterium sp.]